MTHELKIKSKHYDAVKKGDKKFELRKNDRDFKVGDTLMLWKVDENGNRTGEYLKRRILYILQDCLEYGLNEGYCILSLGYMWE